MRLTNRSESDSSLATRLLRHPSGRIGLLGLSLILGLAIVGIFSTPHDPTAANVLNKLELPSWGYPFGTDYLGRDLLSRSWNGAHRSLGSALIVVGGVLGVSLLLGTAAGLLGGVVDSLIMRVADVLLGLPSLILALVLVGLLGPSLHTLVGALVIAQAPWYTRVLRSMVLRESTRPYALVARVHGAGAARIVWRHVLPGVVGQLAVLASLDLGTVLLSVAGLSFLGMGVQPPDAEWGMMLSDGRMTFAERPLAMILPGSCIFVTVLMANLLGDALRDLLDVSSGDRE